MSSAETSAVLSSENSDRLELLREWVQLHNEITNKSEDREYYHAPETRSGSSVKKSQIVTGIHRRSSEEDDDRFKNLYMQHGLIEPVFPFHHLQRLREESDTLTASIRSVVNNTCLLHDLEFIGDDKTEKSTDANQAAARSLNCFFSRVNEKESFLTLRTRVEDDEITTGNGFAEVIRNAQGYPERLYYSPSTHMRVTRLDEEETPIDVVLPRDGKLITIPWTSSYAWGRTFRRFARINLANNVLSWFKEFGDPRVVDATTGEYIRDSKGDYLREPSGYPNKATEIWWFRNAKAGEPYGLPPWLPAIHNVVGRYIAQWINRDHLDQGAIPPFGIVPKGGSFTPKQVEAIRKILKDWRRPGTYNEPIIFDIKPNMSFNFNAGPGQTQTDVEIVKLRDPSNEDFMFSKYLKETEDAIRKVLLLPPLYIGSEASYAANSYAQIEIAENQVFDPIKLKFDEKVTVELIQHEFNVYNWRFRTKQSKINDREVYYRAMNTLSRGGGLSINQTTQLGNTMMGTDFSTHEGPIYDEPWAVVMRVISPDNVRLIDGEFQYINPQPAAPFELIPTRNQTPPTEAQPPETPTPSVTKEEHTPEDDSKALFEIMSRIEQQGYEPPEIKEKHYEL